MKETPKGFLEDSKIFIKNPITTIRNCIVLLGKMPELSVIFQEISSYLGNIEGNEGTKGMEIGHFIAEQIIHLLLPSKIKVISSLAKFTKIDKLTGKAAGIIAGELEKAGKGGEKVEKITKSLKHFLKQKKLPTRGKIRFIPHSWRTHLACAFMIKKL